MRTNPSAEEFKQQAENNTRQRQSRRQSDQAEQDRSGNIDQRPSRNNADNVTWIRERRGLRDAAHNHERRQHMDRRGFDTPAFNRASDRAPGLTTVGSGFMAQLIAQEIVPDINRQQGLMGQSGVAAYESSMARAEMHIDPFNAYAERV